LRLPVDSLLNQRMNAPDMRSVNGIQLLNLIRESGPLSRASLAKLSRLSKPTVSGQVTRLIELGVVVELGQAHAGLAGGKRPTLVAFHAAAGRVAGIGIGPEITRIGIADLAGELILESQLRTAPEQGPRRLSDRIERALSALLARDSAPVRAISIGVPGRVDCGTGVVLESGNVFGWRDVDFRSQFAETFACPVLVDNDVNIALLAELHSGAARDAGTAVLIRVGMGVGSAVAIERHIHHGTHWAAGEIGHLAAGAAESGRVSPRGQLELIVGSDRIARRVRSAARRSRTIRDLLKVESEITALFDAAKQRDAIATEIVGDICHHLSITVANQALAYDPDVVLLSGEIFRHSIADIRRFLSRTVPWPLRIEQAHFGDNGVLVGAVNAALVCVYEQMSRQVYAGAVSAHSAAAGA
jgi:predicted NBD/HSP70 family sugar kinase